MTGVLFAIPGDLATRTGGYGYDRRVLEALPGCGIDVIHCPLQGNFPDPSQADVTRAACAINASLRPGDVVLVDGLAYGTFTEAAIRAIKAPIVALCHHPLGLETGLTPARRRALLDNERMALSLAAHVIVTSAHTGHTLVRDFEVPDLKVSVAIPGTDPASRAVGSGGPPVLLSLGSIIPRKGFDVLVEALAGLTDLDWRLRVAGSALQSPETAARLMRLIETRGLVSRIECLGELPATELDRVFDTSDIYVSAALYEGYGMALTEAMARGLPIVTTTGGAAAETVPDAAGLKVSPGDAEGMREALRLLIVDKNMRSLLADASWRAGQSLPLWRETARVIAGAVQNIVPERDLASVAPPGASGGGPS